MKKVLFLFLLLAGMTNVYGQKFAVKSNLLYDATATINLGVEMGLSKHWTCPVTTTDGSLATTCVGSIGWFSRKHVIGYVRSLTVIFSECMPIMPIIMSAGSSS